MGRFVALLRAINVGGTGKLAMADLRSLLEGAGFSGVRTFIASGNVVFDAKGNAVGFEKKIEGMLAERHGLATDVLVRSIDEWELLVAANPFAKEAKATPGKVVLVALKSAPDGAAIDKTNAGNKGKERVRVVGREAYVYYPDGIGVSKLNLKPLGTGTARNWNSVIKLLELMKA
jgi:uncharacterized protein (DUF1697 family)